MVGTQLANRYDIVRLIGGGGMALVYLAKDTFLGRPVAIKVLRGEFSNDPDFVRRFKKEAQAVASLSHPNIVNVYDLGQSEQDYYLVMEFVEGKTLKEYLDEHGPLSWQKTIEIAKQICDGLEQAHDRSIVHRDIKPHNILMDIDGRAKVTDFGIAQAINNATITHSKGLLGSAHYFSPEQARGESVGVKSDIYSLGVLMYQLVSNQLPFSGDNPVTVALKHIQEQPASLIQMGVEMPPKLEKIILKAMEKNPAKRYDSIAQMRGELLEVLLEEMVNPYGMSYNQQEVVVPNREQSSNKEEEKQPLNLDYTLIFTEEMQQTMAQREAIVLLEEEQVEVIPPSATKVKEKHPPAKKKVKKGNLILVAIFAVVALGAGLVFGMSAMGPKEVMVPDLAGKTEIEAAYILGELDLKLTRGGEAYDDAVKEDSIISQEPKAGNVVKTGRSIEVVISKGIHQVVVPNLVGVNSRKAIVELENIGLVGSVTETYSEDKPEGNIISQVPHENQEVPVGSRVELIVSKGKKLVEISMPNLSGLTLTQAETVLGNDGFIRGEVKYEEGTEVKEGYLISQSVKPFERIKEGSTINLVVSSGPGPDVGNKQETIEHIVVNDGNVQIEVNDRDGKRIVYNEDNHVSGDFLQLNVSYSGEGTVYIYNNGELIFQKSLE